MRLVKGGYTKNASGSTPPELILNSKAANPTPGADIAWGDVCEQSKALRPVLCGLFFHVASLGDRVAGGERRFTAFPRLRVVNVVDYWVNPVLSRLFM
jgi:hypothetical protein